MAYADDVPEIIGRTLFPTTTSVDFFIAAVLIVSLNYLNHAHSLGLANFLF